MIILVGDPYAVYATASGKRYVADQHGLIQVIDLNDVGDLKAAGATQGPVGARATLSIPTVPASAGGGAAVMAGLAGTITPTVTGNALLIVQGTGTNSQASNGLEVQLCLSEVPDQEPPAGGAAASGSVLAALSFGVTGGSVNATPFSIAAYATGLTLGRSYWYDLAITPLSGGTASISDVSTIAIEL